VNDPLLSFAFIMIGQLIPALPSGRGVQDRVERLVLQGECNLGTGFLIIVRPFGNLIRRCCRCRLRDSAIYCSPEITEIKDHLDAELPESVVVPIVLKVRYIIEARVAFRGLCHGPCGRGISTLWWGWSAQRTHRLGW
jgi:hypothetical protein